MAIKIIKVMRPAKKKFGKDYPAEPTEYDVEIDKGKSISIFKDGVLKNTFMVGDMAEHGSYNLSYYGPITSISDTTVCVDNGKGTCKLGVKRAFMNLYNFCWRNADFDLETVQKSNSETMLYI